MQARVAIEPPDFGNAVKGLSNLAEERRRLIEKALLDAGGELVRPEQANVLIWMAIGDPAPLIAMLDANPQIKWVQLPWAGVENFAVDGLLDRPVTFTCAKGAYGQQVAEHALMLMLATQRNVTEQARTPRWHQLQPDGLAEKRVTILGAGGIAQNLIPFLQAARCDITVLRRSPSPADGARRTLFIEDLDEVLPATDILVLALALTPETTRIIGARQLDLLPRGAIVVNVARGALIDTDALVASLQEGALHAAGLDVTEPEPLPEGHPLWSMNNVLITSHCADSVDYVTRKLVERIDHNIRAWIAEEQLIGAVDPASGY